MDTLAVEAASKVEANKLLRLQEKTLIEEHSVYIKKENERRKGIIDERERVRKENE